MMQLIKYELNKILSLKVIYIGIAVFIGVYSIYVYQDLPYSLNNYRNVYSYYRNYEGNITAEKVQMAEVGMGELDRLYHQGIKLDDKNLARKLLYKDTNSAVIQKKVYDKSVREYEGKGSINAKEKLSFKLLKRVGPVDSVYYTEGWKVIIEFLYQIGYYFSAAIVLIGISNMFPMEYLNGMEDVIGSTKEGKRKLVLAKIAAAAIYTIIIGSFFSLINLIINWYIYGLMGYNVPLKNIYYNTSLDITIYQFFIIQQIIFVGAILTIGLLTMLISIISRSSIMGVITGGGIFLCLDFISRTFGDKLQQGTVMFLIGDFIRLRELGRSYLNIYSVLGRPITYEVFLILLISVILMILIAAIYLAKGSLKTERG